MSSATYRPENHSHKGQPNYAARRIGALVMTAGALAGAAEAGNHFAHLADSDSSVVPARSSVHHPNNAEELTQFAAEHPKKVEDYQLKPGMTAGSIAGDLAKKGYYYQLQDEIKEQQDGAILPDHGTVVIEKRLLEDPNAAGLVPHDSGS